MGDRHVTIMSIIAGTLVSLLVLTEIVTYLYNSIYGTWQANTCDPLSNTCNNGHHVLDENDVTSITATAPVVAYQVFAALTTSTSSSITTAQMVANQSVTTTTSSSSISTTDTVISTYSFATPLPSTFSNVQDYRNWNSVRFQGTQDCYGKEIISTTPSVQSYSSEIATLCLETYSKLNYKYAGLEDGGECWRDNVINGGKAIVSSGCNMPCRGILPLRLFSSSFANPFLSCRLLDRFTWRILAPFIVFQFGLRAGRIHRFECYWLELFGMLYRRAKYPRAQQYLF